MICEICGKDYYGEANNVMLCKKHYEEAPINNPCYREEKVR